MEASMRHALDLARQATIGGQRPAGPLLVPPRQILNQTHTGRELLARVRRDMERPPRRAVRRAVPRPVVVQFTRPREQRPRSSRPSSPTRGSPVHLSGDDDPHEEPEPDLAAPERAAASPCEGVTPLR
jgi:hypothetical protein